jgi:hypothetical protein
MPHREITDLFGAVWTVWRVDPPASRVAVPAALRAGWLAFQYGGERRRLAPVADDWAMRSDEELLALLARSEYVGELQRAIA